MSLITNVLADANSFDHMNGWGGGWMWLWGVAMMTLFVVLIAWFVRAPHDVAALSSAGSADPLTGAQRILAERYAKGELSTDEYRERAGELT